MPPGQKIEQKPLSERKLRLMSKEPLLSVPAKTFIGARDNPTVYPGERPDGSYLLWKGNVHLMDFDNPKDPLSAYVYMKGERISVDKLLKDNGLATMKERIMIGGYGSNPCPGQLEAKWQRAREKGEYGEVPDATVVFSGTVSGIDVVVGSFSVYGYPWADILIDDRTKNTVVDFWYTLVDSKQTKIMNDDERIRSGEYVVTTFPGCTIDGTELVMEPLAYAGNASIFLSKSIQTPIAFDSIKADGRALYGCDAVGSTELILSDAESGMAEEMYKLLGIGKDIKRKAEAVLFALNRAEREGRTGDNTPHGQFIRRIRSYMKHNSIDFSLVKMMEAQNRTLTPDHADSAAKEHTFGEVLAKSGSK